MISWVKGVDDGVDIVDVEMSRLSQDGIIYVAKDGMWQKLIVLCLSINSLLLTAPTAPGALNVFLQDIPPGDDYYLIFLNSTSGNLFGSSSKFSIGSTANGTSTSPSAATVTVSGSPYPTQLFATTFPPNANAVASPGWQAIEGSLPQMAAMLGVVMMCLLGGTWAVL